MNSTIYILSHSSMDLMCVLTIYEKYKFTHDVRILIGSTRENLLFFKKLEPKHIATPTLPLWFNLLFENSLV